MLKHLRRSDHQAAIELDGERIDVVSEGSYIDRGKNVTIVKVEGSRIVVRESEEKGEIE